jgi:lipase maturation factor 1
MYTAESYSIALGCFPRLLGLVYLLAFGSLLVQVRGLYGSQGILPIHELVTDVRRNAGSRAFLRIPSIFWINTSDTFITASAVVGVCLSIYLLTGLPPLPALILLWLIYLSFASLGQEFLSYQWDALLLETGFMTIFLPLANTASPLVCLAYQLFIFRFMLSAGTVKLTSRDPNWRNLRAMCFHYETQPIPNRIAWYTHQLPEGIQKFSTLGTFLFELVVPFLALGPAPFKLACFCLLAFFQGLIILTGNYGFFNCLTLVLAVPLLEDRYLGFLGRSLTAATQMPWLSTLAGAVFGIIILLNILQLIRLFLRPQWLRQILGRCGRWQISNPYGLFAVMTTERYEFVIEGSRDLKLWLPYEFHWKPGDPALPPRQAAPHQPRLDWQMWFAALNPGYVETWLTRLVQRLLEGSPAVLGLFRTIPFTPAPPDYIRLKVYRYHFSDPATKRASGRWWNRTAIGRSEPMSLRP